MPSDRYVIKRSTRRRPGPAIPLRVISADGDVWYVIDADSAWGETGQRMPLAVAVAECLRRGGLDPSWEDSDAA
jgi:hypothetical protein